MVRLKVIFRGIKGQNILRFNSTMVRLKGHAVLFQFFCFRRFNSTMVRLKESVHEENIMGVLFQFHYGSIKGGKRD